MAIAYENPPLQSKAALQEGLDSIKLAHPSSGNVLLSKLHNFPSAADEAQQMPHQIYALGLKALYAGDPLENAKPLTWRYIVDPTPDSILSADVRVGDAGKHIFSEFGQNRIAAKMVAQLNALAADESFSQNKFVVRLLRVFGLKFAALWLHQLGAKDFKDDIFIPLPGASDPLTAGEKYSRDKLAEALHKEAEEQIKLVTDSSS
jgi:hypothetical protein